MAPNFSTALSPFGSRLMDGFLPEEQPARRPFGISRLHQEGRLIEIGERTLAEWPFCTLVEFARTPAPPAQILLVAPLSGHFPLLLREAVIGLLAHARVFVTDWINARHVPIKAGDFGLTDNIRYILRIMKRLGRDLHVIALCQAAVPTLAATAILSQQNEANAPRSLVLIGGPVDPLANPTRVVTLLRQRPLSWFKTYALRDVESNYPGRGRLVYPASHQHAALVAYLLRHIGSRGELYHKIMQDDGLDREHYSFLELYLSLMDLPAENFLENIQKVFHERAAWTGQLLWQGEAIRFGAIRNTALMTVEGEYDDIAAPGQTNSAHDLCPNIPQSARHRYILPQGGHFSLFYGQAWRERVLPEIKSFCGTTAT